MLTDASIEGKVDHLLGPEGERDHREADPGGDRAQAVPARSRSGRPRRCRRRPTSARRCWPRSQEIGSDGGDGIDLASLGLDFGGEPSENDQAKPQEATEAEEIPEVDSPLDNE